ncbi:MAG: Hemolysin, plasmid, partial [Cyanobacteriota bacterium]
MANYPSSLIVVDSQVHEHGRLVDELGRHGYVRILQAGEDGVAVITDYLSQHPAHTLVVVAHGAPGQIHLGQTSLDLESLNRYTKVLRGWFAGVSSPQIHLYGCQVAAGDAGAEFLAKLHRLTGAGIAASPRLVGHADLGGDWRLDVCQGQTSPQPWVSAELAASYRAVLGSDNFATATVWTSSASTGTTVGATHQLGEPIHDPNLSGSSQATQESLNNSIWWQWTAITTGLITVDTIGSALGNTVLAVYTGGSVNSLNQVAFNDNSGGTLWSQVTFTAVAGTTYYFAVDGVGPTTGAVRLNLNTAPQITSNQVFNINENSLSGAAVGTVQANEPIQAWTLVSGNPDNDNDGNRAFVINSTTGAITVNDAGDLDFEAFDTTYNLLVRATDAGGLSNEQLVTINLQDVNEAPVITSLTTSQSSINEGGQITLSGSFKDLDADDLQTITINWGDGTLNDVIGSANLSGPDANGNLSFPNLRHLYQDNGSYTVTMTVRDAAGLEVTRTTGVVVNNVPPTITQGSTLAITVNEDSPTTFTLNATDPGRLDTLTWSILNQSRNGTASVSTAPTGKSQIISYLPNANFAGTDTFEVKVQDNNGGVDTILVNVTVAPQPDPPSGLNILGDVTALNEGGIFTLTGTFSDPDAGETFTVTINWGDNTPATVLSNSNVTALGNGNYRFTASHTYLADSGAGAFSISAIVRDSAGLTVSDTLSLPVANVAPTIVQGPFLALSTNEDTPLTFNLSATDPADTNFRWSILTPPPISAGTLTFSTNPNGLASQTLVFTPAANFDQPTSFDVQVSDGNGGISVVNVLVDVVPVNDTPATLTLTPSVTTLNEGSLLTLNGSFIDVDTGDSHTVTINWGDGNSTVLTAGDLILNATTKTYTLPASPHTYADEGTYTLSVTVEDADGATVNRTQTITVNNVNPTILTETGTDPGAALPTINGTEDTSLTFKLRASDPGVNDVLQWSISTAPTKGSVTLLPPVVGQPQEFRYTPNANAFGADSFTVRLSDGDGGFDTVVVTVNLAPTNDLPVITANQFTITEGRSLQLTNANLNATDVETFNPNLEFEIVGLAPGERFAVVGKPDNFFNLLDVIEGRVTFIDNGDETAPAFRIIVKDSNIPQGTAEAQANITFTSVNDAPLIGNKTFSVTEGRTTLITNAPAPNEGLSATDEELLLAGRNGELQYTITRIEGGVIQVNGVTQTTFTQADIDNALVTFVHGGEDIVPVLEYTVSDGLLSTPSTAVVNFSNVNDPPKILTNRLELTEGDIVPITLQNISATDPDNDDNALIFTVSGLDSTTTSPTYEGQFERRSGGVWTATTTFTQQDIINGNVRFVHSGLEVTPSYTLTVTDNFSGTGGPLTDSSAATVVFRAVNDVPLFPTNVLSISEGATVVLSNTGLSAIVSTDEETPATGLTYTVSNLVNGQFQLVATGAVITSFTQDDINNGRVQFVHNGGELRPSYTLTVSDGVNEVESPAAITFTNVNDAPILSRNQLTIDEGKNRLITTNDINASDVETNANSLEFTVGQISGGVFTANAVFAGGRFELKDSSGSFVLTSRFTRDDIINQRVQFVHDGTQTRPSYAIQVADLNAPI